ncbi:MAG: hypothetical protein LBU12_09210 [Deltaproteobacteria bacterium]|nr:hypothetical protein [Deltaproteobacteria bacterium]
MRFHWRSDRAATARQAVRRLAPGLLRSALVWATLVWGVLLGGALPGGAARPAAAADLGPEARETLEWRLDVLKDQFEADLEEIDDARQIAALAVRSAAKAWLTASAATDDPDEFDLDGRLAQIDRLWDEARSSWTTRETQALKLYYEAAARLTVKLAAQLGDRSALEAVGQLLTAPYAGPGRAKTALAMEAEAKVLWSNRLCAAASALLKLAGDGRAAEIDDLVEDMINRAEVIAQRKDVHYQARMDLLHLNNVQSLTAMMFLMADLGPASSSSEVAELKAAWLRHVGEAGSQVADLISLTWVANAQIAFPLAYRLAVDLQSPSR